MLSSGRARITISSRGSTRYSSFATQDHGSYFGNLAHRESPVIALLLSEAVSLANPNSFLGPPDEYGLEPTLQSDETATDRCRAFFEAAEDGFCSKRKGGFGWMFSGNAATMVMYALNAPQLAVSSIQRSFRSDPITRTRTRTNLPAYLTGESWRAQGLVSVTGSVPVAFGVCKRHDHEQQ